VFAFKHVFEHSKRENQQCINETCLLSNMYLKIQNVKTNNAMKRVSFQTCIWTSKSWII